MIFIALGSSIGDAKQHFSDAAQALEQQGIRIVKKSSMLQSNPMGGVAQNQFTNAVWQIEFSETHWERINWILLPQWRRQKLKAFKLLKILQETENKAGRKRLKRWDDRTLDLDILQFHELQLQKPTLTIPHPGIPQRPFVLQPWREIVDKSYEIPKFGPIQQLLQNLNIADS